MPDEFQPDRVAGKHIDKSEEVMGAQLGIHDGRSEFWQINIGHVLNMATFIFTMLLAAAGGIAEFATLRTDNADQKTAIADLKTAIGDMRDWRTRQDADNVQFHAQVNTNFDDIKRHLERLDWAVGQRPDDYGYQQPAPPSRPHR
jgi:Zn-dependent M32 family carboxypeptidase